MIKFENRRLTTQQVGGHARTESSVGGYQAIWLGHCARTTETGTDELFPDFDQPDIIKDGRRNPTGDRSCTHIKATAVIRPKIVGRLAKSYGSTYQLFTASSIAALRNVRAAVGVTYSVAVLEGQDEFYALPQDPAWLAFYVSPLTRRIQTDVTSLQLLVGTLVSVRTLTTRFSTSHALNSTHYAWVTTTLTRSDYVNAAGTSYANAGSCSIKHELTYYRKKSDGNHVLVQLLKTAFAGGKSDIPYVNKCVTNRVTDPTGWVNTNVAAIRDTKDVSTVMLTKQYDLTYTYSPAFLDPTNRNKMVFGIHAAVSGATVNSWLANKIHNSTWADLADTAIQNCQYVDVNSLAFAKDLLSYGSEVKSVVQLLSNPLNVKAWASLYLGLRFGSRLTLSDIQKLQAGVDRSLRQAEWDIKKHNNVYKSHFLSVRSRETLTLPKLWRGTAVTRSLNYKVYYKPDSSEISAAINRLCNWGIWPTNKNVWDLIPYSFVVDWFVGVDKLMEFQDKQKYESRLNIMGCTYTFKDTYVIPLCFDDFGFERTDMTITVYARHTSSTIHHSVLGSLGGSFRWTSVLDGFSLLLQKR